MASRQGTRGPLLALVAVSLLGASEPPRNAARAELHSRAAAEGRVRVLVELGLPAAPEGQLRAPGRLVRRGAIADQQLRLLGELEPPSHRVVHRYGTVPFLALEVDPRALAALERSPRVAAVQEDVPVRAHLASSVPVVEGDLAQASGLDALGWSIAILDTGVDARHSFLAGRVAAEACFSSGSNLFDASGDCPNGATSQIGAGAGAHCSYATGCFHGTHVAGIAAGNEGFPSVGTGMAPSAGILAVQVFSRFRGSSCNGAGESPCALSWTSDQVAALEHVYELRDSFSIAAVNMSLGGGRYTSQASCDAAISRCAEASAVQPLARPRWDSAARRRAAACRRGHLGPRRCSKTGPEE